MNDPSQNAVHQKISMTSIGLDGTMPAVPDGDVPIYKLEGPIARRMIDLQLHRFDLEFVAACLKLLLPYHTPVIEREAIWNAAMVRFFKCFASPAVGGRTQLSATRVFRSEPSAAMVSFRRLETLRNKTLVHDENSWTQGKLGVGIKIDPATGKKFMNLPLFYMSLVATTLDDEHVSNLTLLTQCAIKWIDEEYKRLEIELVERLKQESAATLMAAGRLTYTSPSHETAGQSKLA